MSGCDTRGVLPMASASECSRALRRSSATLDVRCSCDVSREWMDAVEGPTDATLGVGAPLVVMWWDVGLWCRPGQHEHRDRPANSST